MKYIIINILIFLLTSCVNVPPPDVVDLSGYGKGASDYWTPVYRAPPVYPRIAVNKEIIGCVHLRHVISRAGKSKNIEVINSVPEGIFDYSAKQALSKYRWEPTDKNMERKPVKSDWLLNFTTTDNPKAPVCVQPKT